MYIYSSLISTRASPRFNFAGNNIASLRIPKKKKKTDENKNRENIMSADTKTYDNFTTFF